MTNEQLIEFATHLRGRLKRTLERLDHIRESAILSGVQEEHAAIVGEVQGMLKQVRELLGQEEVVLNQSDVGKIEDVIPVHVTPPVLLPPAALQQVPFPTPAPLPVPPHIVPH